MIGNRYEYDTMAKCERDLWWFKSLHKNTLKHIKKFIPEIKNPAILDAGCGTGGLMEFLRINGFKNIVGFDLSEDAIEYAKNKGANVRIGNILECSKAYTHESFDVVISNDILTVLPFSTDTLALQNLVSLVKPGGIIILNLAAGKEFSGTHDIAVNMTKRYTQSEIMLLCSNYAEVLYISHWPFFLSPLIFIIRFFQRLKFRLYNNNHKLLSDVKMIPKPLNHLFFLITSLEFLIPFSKPWGSSIFFILRKNKGV